MSLSRTCFTAAVGTLNTAGRVLRAHGRSVVDLSPDRLIRAARARARLSDFGHWDLREPLERLVDALETQAGLTLLGRLTAREHMVGLLENLLYLERNRACTPEIERREITAPVFIVGLPRSGTTVLYNLIALDTTVRTPLTWEVMYPADPAEVPGDVERIRRRTGARLKWAHRLAPRLARLHPIGVDLPQECVALMAQGFRSALFHTLHRVPAYQDWFERDSQRLAFDMHRRMLQHLQARRGGERWLLKNPAHLFSLPPLLRRYPDARLIQLHRDPLRAMPSIASLNAVLRGVFSDRANPREIGPDCAERWARALKGFMAARDTLGADRCFDIPYQTIVASPLTAVERVYEHLGWWLSGRARTAMTEYLKTHRQHRHGDHRYSLRAFGLDREIELKRFAAYYERFDIPIEAP